MEDCKQSGELLPNDQDKHIRKYKMSILAVQ